MNFEQFNFHPALAKAIQDCGYTIPTPIQQKAIPQILLNNDLLGLAQTGTGKTAAFVLPTLQKLHHSPTKPKKQAFPFHSPVTPWKAWRWRPGLCMFKETRCVRSFKSATHSWEASNQERMLSKFRVAISRDLNWCLAFFVHD